MVPSHPLRWFYKLGGGQGQGQESWPWRKGGRSGRSRVDLSIPVRDVISRIHDSPFVSVRVCYVCVMNVYEGVGTISIYCIIGS